MDQKAYAEHIAGRSLSHVELRHLADHVLGLKGVKHGQLVVSSARLWHATGRLPRRHGHRHGERRVTPAQPARARK